MADAGVTTLSLLCLRQAGEAAGGGGHGRKQRSTQAATEPASPQGCSQLTGVILKRGQVTIQKRSEVSKAQWERGLITLRERSDLNTCPKISDKKEMTNIEKKKQQMIVKRIKIRRKLFKKVYTDKFKRYLLKNILHI